MANNNRNGTGSNINSDEICVLCGRAKQEQKLVCYACYQTFQKDLIESVANDLKEISILEWTLKKIKDAAPVLTRELENSQVQFNEFKNTIQKDSYQDIKDTLKMAVAKEVFSEMLETRRQKLWAEKGGGKLYGRLKRLELRVNRIPSFIKELEEKAAERNQGSSTKDSEKTKE